jgi:phosphoenolpyruvate carboxylase
MALTPGKTSPEIEKMVADRIGKATAAQAKALYAAQFMQDLPKIYQAALPITSDQDELKAAEGEIRKQYVADLRKYEMEKKMSAGDKIFAGLRASKANSRFDPRMR